MGSPQSAILAAGGIVVRHDADGDKIAIVQRRRYPGEMALPKGKIEEGEAIPAAAQRETSEETGCVVTDPRFAGAVHYLSSVTCRRSYSSI
jgi:8-oxo-dGTP pyrophosphatase MutT (NUDIX family)